MCSRGWLACERRLKTEKERKEGDRREISEEAGSIAEGGLFFKRDIQSRNRGGDS